MAYIHGEPAGGYGKPVPIASAGGLGMAVAIPVGISIGAVLETAAIVLTAIAAAYLLIKAYEAAQARGIGVDLARALLSAGLGRLVAGARRLIATIRALIERLRRALSPRPQCEAAIGALAAALAEIETTTEQLVVEARAPVPRVQEMWRLMARLRQLASAIRGPVAAAIEACSGTP